MGTAFDIMKKKVKVVKLNDPIQTACKVLTKNKISGTAVVDSANRLVGFISEKDIIKLLSDSTATKRRVKDVMRKRVVSVKGAASLGAICKIFTEKSFRRIPVTEGGKLIGIIDRSDIMDNLLTEHY